MKWLRALVCAVMLALGYAPALLADEATPPTAIWFEETGHNVKGDFAAFYEALGGETTLGRPLTDEFIHGQMAVQLFERLGIERPLDDGEGLRLIPLGLKLGLATPPLPDSAVAVLSGPDQRFFPGTGHLVMQPFLEFYEGANGETLLGQPITEIAVADSRIVQYFENGSLEWVQGAAQPIRIGSLGQDYLRYLDLPASLLQPVERWAPAEPSPTPAVLDAAPPAGAPPSFLEMQPFTTALTSALAIGLLAESPAEPPCPDDQAAAQAGQPTPKLPLLPQGGDALAVAATVKYPVTGQGGSQTVYVQVRDERGERVPQARVELSVRLSAEQTLRLEAQTSLTGRATLTFEVGHPPAGAPVVLDIVARRGNARGAAQTLFTTWW